MEPQQYALWAGETVFDDIDQRRREADELRPRLAALAVRWPDAALELNAVERHLGVTPNRLAVLVRTVIDQGSFTEMLAERRVDHEAIAAALDRSIEKLASHDFDRS